jgi:hypothetical protein
MIVPRRGVALLEVVVAFGLLAVLLTICLQMLAATAVQRRAVDRRAVAVEEAANIIERISALPWDQVTAERLAAIRLSPDAGHSLPNGAVTLAVESSADGPRGKQVQLAITWSDPAGETERPVRLSYWMYAPPTGSSP